MSIRSKILRQLEQRPCKAGELTAILGNNKKVKQALAQLQKAGRIVQNRGVYKLAAKPSVSRKLRRAVLVKLAPTFGFAAQSDGADIFIPGKGLSNALPGDEVIIRLYDRPRVEGSLEGEIVEVCQPRTQFVGTLYQERGRLYAALDDCPFLLFLAVKPAELTARPGDKVALQLPERHKDLLRQKAHIQVVFGSGDKAANCARSLAYAAGVKQEFAPQVEQQADSLPPMSQQEMEDRMDLRSWPIFTIDSAQTKDIDDAISLSQTEQGFLLGVHIADVSHYVQPGTLLDEEAFARGTSVYYADQVAPMLPRRLSNGLCSLNPGEDRLAFSCLMELDQKGRLVNFRFAKTIIHSRIKGVYTEINQLLDGSQAPDEELVSRYQPMAHQLPAMAQLYRLRAALRRERGGIELESRESKLILDEQGLCVEVKPAQRGLSESIIEEFMLLANQCAAQLAREKELPFVYRVHQQPDPERVDRLRSVLRACGLPDTFQQDIPTQQELCRLLEQTRNTPVEPVVHTSILRSMAKACYEPSPKGHFGLALEDYAHFTSPIRRYPDLAIHRILTAWLEGQSAQALQQQYGTFAQQASQQSSNRELAAMQLERTAESYYKAECMTRHLGEEWPGVISGVAGQGLYVELPNTVEGLVHSESFCKGEPVVQDGVRLLDARSGGRWTIGDKVRVKILRTDVALGRIDLALVEWEPGMQHSNQEQGMKQ